jgi:hypothetical protein
VQASERSTIATGCELCLRHESTGVRRRRVLCAALKTVLI